MLYRLICLCTAIAVSFVSCDLLGVEASVGIVAPPVPPELTEAFGEMEFHVFVHGKQVDTVPPESRTLVRVKKGSPSAVLAYPTSDRRIGVLPPAGAVAGVEGAGFDGELRWDQGVLATVVSRLEGAGVPADAVNLRRMSHEIVERAGENQWDIDIDAAVEGLAGGDMHVRMLEPVGDTGVVVEGVDGRWVRGDALRPEYVSTSEGRLIITDLSPGTHYFAHADGSRRIQVTVTKEGEAGWLLEEM